MGREKKTQKTEPEGQQYLYKDEELRLKRSNRLAGSDRSSGKQSEKY